MVDESNENFIRALSKKTEEEIEIVRQAKAENRVQLMAKPNVIALGVGLRTRSGKITDELVLKVYVRKKIPKNMLNAKDLIPASVTVGKKEIPIDVEEAEIPQPYLYTNRNRPLHGGSSISHVNVNGAGTLGVCVTLNDGQVYILSNNHVLSDHPVTPTIGLNIVQPGRLDGGSMTDDVVADLTRIVPIDFGTTVIEILGIRFEFPNPNDVDCAIARCRLVERQSFNAANREIYWVGYPAMPLQKVGKGFFSLISWLTRPVCKMGRTTEYTVGSIVDVDWDGWVGPYANGRNAWFRDQIRIVGTPGRPFSMPGDSGSLIVDAETKRPIGLLFAGNSSSTIVNRIDRVVEALDIPFI